MRKPVMLIVALALALGAGIVGAVATSAGAAGKPSSVPQKYGERGRTAPAYRAGEAIVLFKDSYAVTPSRAAVAKSLGSSYEVARLLIFDGVKKNASFSPSRTSPGGDSFEIALVKSATLSTEELVKQLRLNKNVKSVQPNYIRTISAVTADTFADHQWAIENTGQSGGIPGKSTNVNHVWSSGVKGTEKVVAIIDSGVDYTHEDLRDNIWENPNPKKLAGAHGYDFANNDSDPMDDNGHGSHCAGILGAKGNNNVGISGVNQSVKIMALKFLGSDGSGSDMGSLAAYNYVNRALNLGVNVVAINNSWGGMGDPSIYKQVMDTVGAKGAVSVCAAGNDGQDLEKDDRINRSVPAGVDSEYNVVVGATNEKNRLTSFSNYGASCVDLTAPGADILSTVSYDCFNPTLYDRTGERDRLCSSSYSTFEEGDTSWGMPAAAEMRVNGVVSGTCSAEVTSDSYFGKATAGRSLRLKMKNLRAGDLVTLGFPYTHKASTTATHFSAMVKTRGPEAKGESMLALTELAATDDIASLIRLEELEAPAIGAGGERDYWSHMSGVTGADKPSVAVERKVVLVFFCGTSGTYEVDLDDFGVSKENVNPTNFGKYDFYNGTSMATPYVTGAVALLSAQNPSLSTLDLVERLTRTVKLEDSLNGKVVTGGSLDFTQISQSPVIKSVLVDRGANRITINGSYFTENSQVKVNGDLAEVVSVSDSGKQILIKNKEWINNVVKLSIVCNGQEVVKDALYLVAGKPSYTRVKKGMIPVAIDRMTTDGTSIFVATSSQNAISKHTPASGESGVTEQISTIPVDDIFGENASGSTTAFYFSRDLVYVDGALYTIGKRADRVDEPSSDEERQKLLFDRDGEAGYYSEEKLISVATKGGKCTNLGDLPSELENTDSVTLAGYNGKLYVIGGYNHAAKQLSDVVKIYDPKTKKWSNGPALPEGRAAGRALQSGNSLIYTLGYTPEGVDTSNLIFNGTSWRKSAASLQPFDKESVTLDGQTYDFFDSALGLCRGGVIYQGMPARNYGDTYTYNVAADAFTDTGFNLFTEVGKNHFLGTVVGTTLYGFDEYKNFFKLSTSSGLVKAVAAKATGGTIKGAGRSVLPGSAVTLTAVAKKGYYLKSFTVDGKTIKGGKATLRLTKDVRALAVFAKKK